MSTENSQLNASATASVDVALNGDLTKMSSGYRSFLIVLYTILSVFLLLLYITDCIYERYLITRTVVVSFLVSVPFAMALELFFKALEKPLEKFLFNLVNKNSEH